MISEKEDKMTTLMMNNNTSVIIPNALGTDLKTGIIYIPCETSMGAFYTCDPVEGWAPRKRSFTIPNDKTNGYPIPSGSTATWKHSFGFCEYDGCIYTRFFDGQVVKIIPKTLEGEIVGQTPDGTTCGVTFDPKRPEMLYIAGRSGGTSGGIYVMDVSVERPEAVRINSAGTGFRDGDVKTALFFNPWQIYFDPDGNLYIADGGNHCIRKIRTDNYVETVVGIPGEKGTYADNGGKDEAKFNEPRGVGVGRDGTVYVADWGNKCIRKLAQE
jgi:hypothetical protein